MFERRIHEVAVREVLEHGELIEDRPNEVPHPTRLFLGWIDKEPLHVVASYPRPGIIMVVTAYRPDLHTWKPGFRKRR